MSDRPLVTVIGLCYNTGPYVVQALECVRRQTHQPLQLIIVDDASTDGSDLLVAEWILRSGYRCAFVRQPLNHGIPAALNAGLALAEGKYVTWIADDLWADDRVELVVSFFERQPPDVGVLFGDARVIDAQGRVTGALSPCRTLELVGHPLARHLCTGDDALVVVDRRLVHEALFWRCFLPAPSVTVRRSIYDVIGPYDSTLAIEDLDCWLRTSEHFDFAYLRRPLVDYRVHASNFTSGISSRYLDSLAATLRRRLAAVGPATGQALRRHIREEAYRVIGRLVEAGQLRRAAHTVVRHYLPNMQGSATAIKETVKLFGVLLRGLVGHRRSRFGARRG